MSEFSRATIRAVSTLTLGPYRPRWDGCGTRFDPDLFYRQDHYLFSSKTLHAIIITTGQVSIKRHRNSFGAFGRLRHGNLYRFAANGAVGILGAVGMIGTTAPKNRLDLAGVGRLVANDRL
jgi:hypothetical protein